MPSTGRWPLNSSMLFGRSEMIPEVAVVVLAGAGKAFCTGGDLSVFPSLAEHQASPQLACP